MLKKINPEWPLRLGLGFMYLYSGYDLIVKSSHWYGFVPKWLAMAVTQVSSVDTYLKLQGAGEFAIGVLFLAWFVGRWGLRLAGVLAVLEMALILLFVGIDPITFRDIGLLGAAFAILVISMQEKKIADNAKGGMMR